jgi:hypothetical protein
VLLIVGCLVAGTAAVSGAAGTPPGLTFAQVGHWIANPSQGKVYHVNGAARTLDAEVAVPGMDPGAQVVQGDTSGFVVSASNISEFGKSSLTVENTMTAPADEQPVALEAAGGPYLVYRQAGTVARLGAKPKVIPAGGPLGDPVVTPDGTLWLQRTGSNVLCQLGVGADAVSCPAAAGAQHTGALTVVGKQAVFVDTQDDTLAPLGADGLGRPTATGVDLPAAGEVATADVGGRIAVLDAGAHKLHLVDGTVAGTDRVAAAPVEVDLPAGDYATPAASRSSVVLLEMRHNTVFTYDSAGRLQARDQQVPVEKGRPRLTRGQDRRVYIDGAEGKHVLVVGDDGRTGEVPLAGGTTGPSRAPVAPPAEGGRTGLPPAGSATAAGGRSPNSGSVPARAGGQSPNRPRTDPPARTTNQVTPKRQAVPASPPGMPPRLRATVSGTTIRVTWGAAKANGATVSGYRVTRSPGSTLTRPGSARSASLTGLTRGTRYTITVSAQNSAGRGPSATVRATVPLPARTVTVSRGPDTNHEPDCHPPECGKFHIVMRGFAPNTQYQIDPYSSSWGNFNPGAALTTDSKGTLITNRFAFNGTGQRVWVKVSGVESNHYLWPTP